MSCGPHPRKRFTATKTHRRSQCVRSARCTPAGGPERSRAAAGCSRIRVRISHDPGPARARPAAGRARAAPPGHAYGEPWFTPVHRCAPGRPAALRDARARGRLGFRRTPGRPAALRDARARGRLGFRRTPGRLAALRDGTSERARGRFRRTPGRPAALRDGTSERARGHFRRTPGRLAALHDGTSERARGCFRRTPGRPAALHDGRARRERGRFRRTARQAGGPAVRRPPRLGSSLASSPSGRGALRNAAFSRPRSPLSARRDANPGSDARLRHALASAPERDCVARAGPRTRLPLQALPACSGAARSSSFRALAASAQPAWPSWAERARMG
jgi:hypothetical protein